MFDAPFLDSSPFEDRLACLESLFPSLTLDQVEKGSNQSEVKSPIALVEHKVCQGLDDLKKQLGEVQNMGGEGLMLRQAGSLYVGKRSKTLLKVKTFYDAEAKVVGYEAGKVSLVQTCLLHRGRIADDGDCNSRGNTRV